MPAGQRRRPQIGGPRRGARLGGSTTSTTEKVGEQAEPETEQSAASVDNEHHESTPAVSPSAAAPTPLDANNRGTTGVLGELKNQLKLSNFDKFDSPR